MADFTSGSTSPERLADLGLDSEDYARIERNALFAAILGFLCQVCAMLACCGTLMVCIPGLALGIIALVLSKGVLDSGVDGAPAAYARTSIAMSAVGIAWNGVVTLGCCAYLGLYFMMGFVSVLGNM